MTKREVYELIKETVKGFENEEFIAEFCDKEIELLDKKNASNEKRKEKRKAENKALDNQIITILQEVETATCKEIADELGLSFQKVTPRLTELENNGVVTREITKKVPFFSLVG